MIFRKSVEKDLSQIEEIAENAKLLLKQEGVSQWQKGTYPDRERFLQDIEEGIGYVVEEADELVAVCAVTFTEEPAYCNLSGSWLIDSSVYATIHRSAVSYKHIGKHVITFLFDSVSSLAKDQNFKSIRIDTHPDNLRMQKALERSGFIKCGELFLTSGDEAGDLRFGYEKLI